ncbi:MAG: CRISPR-associated endonuclease Cas6 [Cyclobacteriaceae bacterium]
METTDTKPHTIQTTTLRFTDLRLQRREAAQLRGYFGNLFREHSPLLHNHYEDGSLRYGYPLVQYKVIKGVPTLLGLEEGAGLLTELFLQVRELDIAGTHYTIQGKDLRQEKVAIGVDPAGLHQYTFVNPWLGLNEANYQKYKKASPEEQQKLLQRVLTGNILSFYKGMALRLSPDERILLTAKLIPKRINFKNQEMLGFTGEFTTNALLPPAVGLGKAVSRGFGVIFN